MNVPDSATSRSNSALDAVQSYSMHVSARYLDLTKKKLEVTRLPREVTTSGPQWSQGTPKAVLEPLLDYWLEQYDWRAQEASLNNRLPQFRCNIDLTTLNNHNNSEPSDSTGPTQRIHFVHKRCQSAKSIPLLYCHGWPGSFLEVSKIVDGLSEPYFAATPPGTEAPLGFHVIAPSVPGLGFSDAPVDAQFGLEQTADCFNMLMKHLGYDQYVAHGSGMGFAVARMLSLRHPANCVAVHTISPRFPRPLLKRSYAAAVRYQIASLTGARYERLAFGYTPSELAASTQTNTTITTPQITDPLSTYALRPHTRAFSLTDSPAGLLASMLDILRPHALDIPIRPPPVQPRIPNKPASASSSRSSSMDNVRRAAADPFMEPIRESIESGLSLLQLMRPAAPVWSPDDVLNWTMMLWLPGPECGLRWLNRVVSECGDGDGSLLWERFSSVPLGISTFRHPDNTGMDWVPDGDGSTAEGGDVDVDAANGTAPASRGTWWTKLNPLTHLWRPARKSSSTDQSGSGLQGHVQHSPPSWATAYQRLEWVRRHDTVVRLPVWESSDQVVVDMRECFGDMIGRGLVSFPIDDGGT